MTKIGIIGSAMVAQALAKGFIKHGHEVMLSSRNPDTLHDFTASILPEAQAGTFDQAAQFGDILVLAVKGTAAIEALSMAGDTNIKGKTIIDTTNPISDDNPQDGVLHFFTKPEQSLMELLQDKYPHTNIVKAFNSVGAALMVNPKFPEGKPTMFIAGNNDQAKKEVSAILDTFGWEVEDMGSTQAGHALESLCQLWCIPGFRENRWTHAFKLLKQ